MRGSLTIATIAALTGLAGCATPCPAELGQVYRQQTFRCLDGAELAVSFARQPDVAVIAVNDRRPFTLPSQQTAEGFRFAGAPGVFFGDGANARWNPVGGPEVPCQAEN